MKRLWLIILPVLVLTQFPAAALAGDPAMRAHAAAVEQRRERLREKRERQFRDADSDGSRTLTRAEIEAAGMPRVLLQRFDEIDTDGDDALSPEELAALQSRRVDSARGDEAGGASAE